jgi:hypothetical protein
MSWVDFGQTVGGFATAFGVIFGLAAVWHGLVQIKTTTRLAAHDVYCNFVGWAIQHPEYFPPNYNDISRDPIAYAKYKRFIAYLLTVCERLVLAEQDHRYWLGTVAFYIEQNVDHLGSEDFTVNHLPHYSPPLQKLIQRANKKVASSSSSAKFQWPLRGLRRAV